MRAHECLDRLAHCVVEAGESEVWVELGDLGCGGDVPACSFDLLARCLRVGLDRFELALGEVEKAAGAKTRLLVFNNLQNPTGAESSSEELDEVADFVRRRDLYVLCDEAYFDIRYSGRSQSLLSRPGMAERCIILYTFSKRFAMTGWRLGAAIGPEEAVEQIAKLNVNDESCTNHFVQYAGLRALERGQEGEAAVDPPRAAVQQQPPVFGLEPAPRHVERDALALGRVGQQPPLVAVARLGPGIERALGQRAARVGGDSGRRNRRPPDAESAGAEETRSEIFSAQSAASRARRPWVLERLEIIAGWSSPVARQAHNLKVAGSNPAPATNFVYLTSGPLSPSGLLAFVASDRMPARWPCI